MELADTKDLGSFAPACGFDSRAAHHFFIWIRIGAWGGGKNLFEESSFFPSSNSSPFFQTFSWHFYFFWGKKIKVPSWMVWKIFYLALCVVLFFQGLEMSIPNAAAFLRTYPYLTVKHIPLSIVYFNHSPCAILLEKLFRTNKIPEKHLFRICNISTWYYSIRYTEVPM